MREVEALALASFSQRLLALGFEPLPDPAVEGAFVTVGAELEYETFVSIGRYPSAVTMGVGLAVFHEKVSFLSASFLGLPPSRTASFGSNIDDLMRRAGVPAPYPRIVSGPELVEPVTRALIQDIKEHGLPFLSTFVNLADIASALEGKGRSVFEDEHLAIIYQLLGRPREAMAVLTSIVKEARTQPEQVADQTRRFVRAFSEYFGEECPDLNVTVLPD